jgi:hypothetical protein
VARWHRLTDIPPVRGNPLKDSGRPHHVDNTYQTRLTNPCSHSRNVDIVPADWTANLW